MHLNSFLIGVSLFFSLSANAYIPPTRMILQRTSENNGTGTVTVEQEVSFQTSSDPILLKEVWTAESERTLKLTVYGMKELKDKVKLQFIYNDGKKMFSVNGNKESLSIPNEFFEKLFHSRSLDGLALWMVQNKIAPNSILQRKIYPKKSEEFTYKPEEFVRLSRWGGVVNYAFGFPNSSESNESNAGLWIEQDQFVIRKIKLSTGAEISADNHQTYAKSFIFPKTRSVRWDQNNAQLRVLSISQRKAMAPFSYSPQGIEFNNLIDISDLTSRKLIEEFYTRFR